MKTKHKFKQAAVLFIAVSAVLCGCKSEDPEEKFYTYEDIITPAGEILGISITGCTAQTEEIRIPSSISGKSVVKLSCTADGGDYIGAFESCSEAVERIVVPEGVEEIEGGVFENSISIQYVYLPESLVFLGNSAFAHCEGLREITVPENITELRAGVFSGCKSLERAELPEGLTSIGQSSFSECESLEKIEIPSAVKDISSYAFSGCTVLSEITLPDGLLSIGEMAFDGCEGLTDVTVPDSVKTIGRDAFNGCFDIRVHYRGMTCEYSRLYDIYTLEEGEEPPPFFIPSAEEARQ